MPDYRALIDTRIGGIPARIGVTYFYHHPGGRLLQYADCPEDVYGITEVEFDVLDQRGRPAAWLERKLTNQDRASIEQQVVRVMNRRDE